MGYLSYKWQWLCSACRNHNLTLSLLMTYHWVCNKSNATGTTGGTGTAYTSGTHECIPGICSICMFLYSVCTSLCVLLSFLTLHCQFFFDLRPLITTLVYSSISSNVTWCFFMRSLFVFLILLKVLTIIV